MKKYVFCFSLLLWGLLFSEKTFASEAQPLFSRANKFYQQKEYKKAIALYDSVLTLGYESAALYYNLGNAHFKNGDNAHAVLNYERARKLRPGDEDIEFNLRLANLRVADKIEALPELLFVKWWNGFVSLSSSQQWIIYAVICLWVSLTAGVIFIFTPNFFLKRISFFSGIFILLIVLLLSVFAFSRYKNEQQEFAIVFSPNAYVKSAPDEEGIDLFILHEGVKVAVKDEVGAWRKIKLADGKEGWVTKEAIEII